MHCELLDREFHTPALVCSRSPFLLTTSEFASALICAIIYLLQSVPYHQNFTLSNRTFINSSLNSHKSLRLASPRKAINLSRLCRRISFSLFGGVVPWNAMNTTKRGCCWEWQSGSCSSFHRQFVVTSIVQDGDGPELASQDNNEK